MILAQLAGFVGNPVGMGCRLLQLAIEVARQRGRAPGPRCPAAGRPGKCLRRGLALLDSAKARAAVARQQGPAPEARIVDADRPQGAHRGDQGKAQCQGQRGVQADDDQCLPQVLAGPALCVKGGVGDAQDLGGHGRIAADGLRDLRHFDVRIAGKRNDFGRDPRRAGKVDLSLEAIFEVLGLHVVLQMTVGRTDLRRSPTVSAMPSGHLSRESLSFSWASVGRRRGARIASRCNLLLTLNSMPKRISGSYVRGGVPKRPTGADCKSAGLCLRRFESYPLHHCAGVVQW